MSGGFRASSIPSNVRKTIQNIQEMTGNHSVEEVYAMLKECSMDPNETAQRLLLQDTFHEVKSRKDRKKEYQANREIADSRWRSGPLGRGGRGGRGNYTSRYAAQDASVGRNSASVKENGINQASDKVGSISSAPVAQETKRKDDGSSVIDMANGPIDVVSGGTKSPNPSEVLSGSGTKQPEISSQPQSHSGGNKTSHMESGVHVESIMPAALSGTCSPASDPVVVPSPDTRIPAAVGAIKCEVGNQLSPVETNLNISIDHKPNAGKMGGKSQRVGKNQAAELLQPSSSSHGSSSSSRPSSNYGSRSQQAMGSQKVGPNKEWKPKLTNSNTVQAPKTPAAFEGSITAVETCAQTQTVENKTDSEDATSELKELEGLCVRDAQHVIIPNHIHVPDAVRTGLSFGSFDSAFVIAPKSPSRLDNDKSESVPETEQEIEDSVEEATSQNTLAPAEEADYIDYSQSPKQAENLSSGDVSVPSSSTPEFRDPKETASGPEQSIAHSSASYNFALTPPMLGNPLGSVEASETQARDVSRVPNFIVQQPVDPSSFYAQFYRSGADSDGRISPFAAHGVASKYSGNIAVLSSQSPPEGVNSLVLSAAAQTPLATPAAGLMPSSIAVTQQPMALFRQPAGVHIPHFPPNYIPYGHYFPPFYVPPPAMHQFLGNSAFPQQAPGGSVYPGPPAATAAPTAVKFPVSHYKPGSNTGNSAHLGVGGGYGPYGASPAGYNPGSAATAGTSTASEDLAASQFKESNFSITGQQSEGSAVWIPAAGRDISSLPANSFYNLPQGHPVTLTPTHAGQGSFAGMYHPAQAVTAASVHPLLQQSQAMPGAVDIVGATASVYQQPQHAQINWANNY